MAFRGFLMENCMGELDQKTAVEKVLRRVAIIVVVTMLLTFVSIELTGLSFYTTISAALLMLSTATLFVMDMRV